MSKARSILGLLIMCGAAAAAIAQSPPPVTVRSVLAVIE